MKLGLPLLRWIVGGLFVGHGTQKLFGWFGGHGPDGTGKFFESLGLRPGRRHALAAGAAEAGGGGLLAVGLFTPGAAAALIGTMFTAIRKVHGSKGPWVTDGGYEYNLVLMAAVLALADAGPGEWSLDHALGTGIKGPLVALLALAGGIGGAYVMTELTASEPEPARQSEPENVPAPEPSGAAPVGAGAAA
jgi:putative oxidoreductase